MRISKPALLVLGAGSFIACAGGTQPEATYSIQGTVIDSVAAKVVSGLGVSLGGKSATTDFAGSYQISGISRGDQTLTVSDPKFESYAKTLSISTALVANVALRRKAPFLKDFTSANNGSVLAATIIDLQGRDTFAPSQSTVFFSGPGFDNLTTLFVATITTIDAYSVRVQVNTGHTGISSGRWTLNDVEGNHSVFICGTGGCTEQ